MRQGEREDLQRKGLRLGHDDLQGAFSLFAMLCGTVVLVTPWLLHYTSVMPATLNAWVVGAAIILCASGFIVEAEDWQAFALFALGAWTCISPYVLHFTSNRGALDAQVYGGLATSATALVKLAFFYWALGAPVR